MDKDKIFNIIFSGALKALLFLAALILLVMAVNFFLR